MDRRSIGRVIAAAAFAVSTMAAAPAGQVQTGEFALADSRPAVRAELTVHQNGAAANRLDIAQYAPNASTPIQTYRVDQTKLLHLVLIRDDFAAFQHVHPQFANGHFTVDVALDAGHRYYAYSDSRPANYPQQVFRFVLQAGAPPHTVSTTVWANARETAAGPYHVTLTTVHLAAGKSANVPVRITRDGRVASDLHPYLGAAAHAVFIDTRTLSYVHVHPMTDDEMADMDDMPHMNMSSMHHEELPENAKIVGAMTLMVPALKPGLYKLWLQFRGGTAVYVAPFTLAVR